MAGVILTSCASVVLQDHEICGSLAAQGASCAHFLTDETRMMNLQQFAAWWDDLKDPKVATSISTILDWKGDIEKLCTDQPGVCSASVEAKVDTLAAKMSKAATTIQKIAPATK